MQEPMVQSTVEDSPFERLQRKLSPEQQRECVPLEGEDTTLSGIYSPEMVTEILKGVRDLARHDDPQRFTPHGPRQPRQLFPIFDLVDETFHRLNQRNYLVPHSDPIWPAVCELVPWARMERIQVVVQPVVLRLPSFLPHTHRGCALRFTDGTYEIEFEDLSQVQHPRGRFAKPVSVGIFMYGYGDNDDEVPQSSERDMLQDGGGGPNVEPSAPDLTQHILTEDNPRMQIRLQPPQGIHFHPSLHLTAEIKGMLSRVHRNMGHPSPAW